MSEQEERRRRAREDLVRVQKEHAQKQGQALPNMREIEKKAQERADMVDRKRD